MSPPVGPYRVRRVGSENSSKKNRWSIRAGEAYSCRAKNFSYSFVQSGARNMACPSFRMMSPRQTWRHTLDSS